MSSDVNSFPMIVRPSMPPEGVLATAVVAAFDIALGETEIPAPSFLDIDGMSGRRYRIFANALLRRVPEPRYLEVGVWAGSTLCSAIAGNAIRAVAVDNWSLFGGPRARFLENLARFGTSSEVRFIESDFRAIAFEDQGRFNVYLFDGPHTEADQYDGLALALPALDSEFIFMVDDWNWAEVRAGTRRAIERLGLEEIHTIEVRTTADDTHPPHCGFEAKMTDWHNGCFISVLRKQEVRPPLLSRVTANLKAFGRRWISKRLAAKAIAEAEHFAAAPASCEVLAMITHHHVPGRLPLLAEVLRGLAALGTRRMHAIIVTNTADPDSKRAILDTVPASERAGFSFEIVTVPPVLHPYDLPWAQKPLLVERFLGKDSTFTHFISLEDDMALGREGFEYWLRHRPLLAAHGLIPSFVRTETRSGDPTIYVTDAFAPVLLTGRPSVRGGEFDFITLDNPYCATFVLDRALALEYATSQSFRHGASMAVSPWMTRERAAMGLCWEEPPPGFAVRHVVPVDVAAKQIASCAHIRHLPGNYAIDPASPFGKVPLRDLLRW